MDDFAIIPIEQKHLDDVDGACWESRQIQHCLLSKQQILGMAAWEGERCVGQLHCYSVTLPKWDDANFPGYGRANPVSWPLGWPLLAAAEKGLSFDGPVWGHACFHVGFADTTTHQANRAYFGRGIGTALCRASIQWARGHGYAAVIAHGGTKAAPEYNVWMGCLPWTTYERMGFECIAQEEDGARLPWWTGDDGAPSDVLKQVEEALAAGSKPADLCARLMLLRL